ncbi:hypothetical protein KAR29_10905 [Aminithiophilus ramosus]|uniref:Uncharacterized protein n=2 Tax=Synergistales TaxID=649776 RepID=A0A9Q7AB22_9BACT|nr:hypothetical protein [Aminithiophilus ramosus]QTX31833.1 hypothetical protein KAR29_10905 [Aminithiophilus ramosus]QVL35657.1 hypothetical protein KIH16_10840 [Synergistota bacterium]
MRISEMATLNTTDVMQTQKTTATTSGSETQSTTGTTDEVGISSFADLMSKLKDLKETDPEAFTTTVTDLAADVREEAASSSGMSADKLNELADSLDTVAETGDLSALQPKAPQEQGGFTVSANGIYGPSNGQPPSNEENASMESLFATLAAKVDDVLNG